MGWSGRLGPERMDTSEVQIVPVWQWGTNECSKQECDVMGTTLEEYYSCVNGFVKCMSLVSEIVFIRCQTLDIRIF